jgi:hypothetical protein
MSNCACLCGGLPAQVLGQQPDQHDRQRGVYRTDGAYLSVRRGAVGFYGYVWFSLLGACMDVGAFFAGLI